MAALVPGNILLISRAPQRSWEIKGRWGKSQHIKRGEGNIQDGTFSPQKTERTRSLWYFWTIPLSFWKSKKKSIVVLSICADTRQCPFAALSVVRAVIYWKANERRLPVKLGAHGRTNQYIWLCRSGIDPSLHVLTWESLAARLKNTRVG